MKQYDKNNKIHRLLISIIVLVVSIINIIFLIGSGHCDKIFFKDISTNPTEHIYQDNFYRQTFAFAHKRLSFLENASSLKYLNNPYRVEERIGIYYLFDTTYYKGKYYSYYTILPIIFILLPIYLISGYFLNLIIVNFLILTLVLYFIGKLYQFIIEKYIKNIPLFLYILGFLVIIFGSNIFLLLRGFKYDIPISCGILFITLSIYLLSLLSNKKFIKTKLILAGIFTAFIVLSKPSYIIYYFLIFYIVYIIYKKYIKSIKLLLYYTIPIAVIALFQMGYNYLRYDSIFEFGIQYQLTGFNLREYIGISPNKILRGFKYYLFQPLHIDLQHFPYIFIQTNYDNHLYTEFLYENIIIGLFSLPVVVFAFILSFFRSNHSNIKNFLKIGYIIFIPFVIFNTTYGGVAETYSLDFKIVISFISVLFLFTKLDYSKNKKLLASIIIVFILNILLMIPISYNRIYY